MTTRTSCIDNGREDNIAANLDMGTLRQGSILLDTDLNFRNLPLEAQNRLRALMQFDRKTRQQAMVIVKDPYFTRLLKEVSDSHLEKLAGILQDLVLLQQIIDSSKECTRLEENKKFQKLSSVLRERVMKTLAMHVRNRTARANLIKLVTDSNFSRLSLEHQEIALHIIERNPADRRVADSLRKSIRSPRFWNFDHVMKSKVLDMAPRFTTFK